jgi:hypothetical protein
MRRGDVLGDVWGCEMGDHGKEAMSISAFLSNYSQTFFEPHG